MTRMAKAPTAAIKMPALTVQIQLDRIMTDPNNPRQEFAKDDLKRLSQSLAKRGQLQPIRVRQVGAMKYAVIVGERRFRAAKLAGLKTIACIVENRKLTEGEILQDQLIENCLRENLTPIEAAKAYKSLMDQNGWSIRRCASELDLPNSTVCRALELLNLPPTVQAKVQSGKLGPSKAYVIRNVGTEQDIEQAAEAIVAANLTRTEVLDRINGNVRTLKSGKIKTRDISTRLGRISISLKRAGGIDDLITVLDNAIDILEKERQTA